jgi:restriction system protein
MARRRVSIFDVLFVRPWRFSVIAAGVVYALLAYGPQFLPPSPVAAGISMVTTSFAPYVAGLFLLTAFFAFLRAFNVRRRFNKLESIERIRQLSWRQFEAIVAEAFRRRGYRVTENAVDGPDGGIDLVLLKGDAKFYVQCKQWKQTKISVKPVRELYGVISAGGAASGFFVASGEYTRDAREFARRCGIELIDGPALLSMIAATADAESRGASPRR